MASSAASSHVNALQSKHAGLEARLRDEMARPAPDASMIQSLKKQKLRLKEEIARC
ncbi:MAG: YdcH family protein [Erythrobacter sp.]